MGVFEVTMKRTVEFWVWIVEGVVECLWFSVVMHASLVQVNVCLCEWSILLTCVCCLFVWRYFFCCGRGEACLVG